MSNDLYTLPDDIRLQYGTLYQLRLRQFDVDEWRGELFENRSWERHGGKFTWRRRDYRYIRIKGGKVLGFPNGSFLELYAIKMWNEAFPEAKIQSDYWTHERMLEVDEMQAKRQGG